MAGNVIKKVRIALKRESASYFESVKDTLIPLKGEVIIVDTEKDGVRTKIGDGVSTFAKLPFTDEQIRDIASGNVVHGYYFENAFYTTKEHSSKIVGYDYKIYIDVDTRKIYGYFSDTQSFSELSINSPAASSSVAGVSKLYNELGNNDDGSINQRAVTEEINKKFTITLDHDEGLIFEDGIPDNEV